MILKLAGKLLASSFQFFASSYVNTPCFSNPMSSLFEKELLNHYPVKGLLFCPRQHISLNLLFQGKTDSVTFVKNP